ncbi:MAG: adenylyltransferase/cytidyltransferase family protein [Candidatus Peribacter sp.]|jgi:FAD synthetase|nr:adenylyltransferase/cytidyltransferase family protein [Candidatus Peribacter sp.]MBT4393076.1 adenylyltransferase/cytidyltransferase family protein [Candidatus Peribacter sp.]MBT4600874.1 adenylyltransferase/cytidyltransferase family protein [Candidatus Peribacter sp.]MBT5148995.1 adenylyltransferase/cytidyltransferase family protein [Candidatus Peribacter sp.]MBT5638325.1 adenylyltransferase/cytidyltransferase family protein [Candidatus Peribacter sp.]
MKVLTFGTFDHLHPGHEAYLNEASSKGDLFIIIARDAHVEEIKGIAPDQSESERLSALKAAFPDAYIQLGDADDYLKPVRDISPDIIVMGYDQKLPPGISESDLECSIEVAKPYKPEEHKSSLRRENG